MTKYQNRGLPHRAPEHRSMRHGHTYAKPRDMTVGDADEIYLKIMQASGSKKLVCLACGVKYREAWIFEGECWPSCDRTAELTNLVQGMSERYDVSKIKKAMEDEGVK